MAEYFKESSAFLVFVNIIMVFMLYRLTKSAVKPPHVITNSKRKVAICLIFMFVIFSFWGADWFHYREGYQDFLKGDVGHMETIYGWIAQSLTFGYLSFRFIIWGGALVLLNTMVKKLPVQYDIALFLFGSIWLIWFSYARVSVAMTFVFLSVPLFLGESSSWRAKMLALFFLLISVYFHKTALFGILCIMLAYSINKLPKYVTILILVVGVVLLYLNLTSLLNDFVSLSVDYEDGNFSNNVAVGQYYLNAENVNTDGIGDRVAKILERGSYYFTFFCCIQYLRLNNRKQLPDMLNIFLSAFIIIVLLSSLFYFDFGFHTRTLATRFMRFAMIPSIIVMTYFIETGFKPRLTKLTITISLLSTFYSLLYSFYCHL